MALPSGTSTAGPQREKRNKALQSSALIHPEQDHKRTTSARPLGASRSASPRIPSVQGWETLSQAEPRGGFYTPQLQISKSCGLLEM